METSTTAYQPVAPSVAQAPAPSPQATNSQPNTAQSTSGVDQGALTLTRAIALQESSNDGQTPNYSASGDAGTSYGAYQWNNGKAPLQPGQLPTNFVNAAKAAGLDPTDFSPENQDKVAYSQVLKMKQQGLSPEQIAAAWNGGMGIVNSWQNHVGTTEINGQQVSYNTPAYVQGVQKYYGQLAQSMPQQDPTGNGATPQKSPSLGGFLENTVQSGANFLGNLGNAVLHPIQTAQNIGGAAVGGLQELGGQTTDNTAKFDNLKNYFSQRYGSVDNLLHTAYTDPVGLAGDLSAALGVGGGLADIGAAGADAVGLGARAVEAGGADFVAGAEGAGGIARSTAGSGLAGALENTGDILSKGSTLTNPLSPIVAGASKLIDQTKNISDIVANPQNYTPEDIANSTSEKVASDVQDAFEAKRADLSETGSAYSPFKQTPAPLETTPDGLDNLIRDSLKVEVKDGIIKPTSTSLLRDSSAISKLQSVYNTYKGDFLNGTMDSQKFLNLRSDLGDMAYNDLGIKNTKIAGAADDVRSALNSTYRDQIPGLSDLDSKFSTAKTNLQELENGLVQKTGLNKGDIKPNFITKALKAAKTGDTSTLDQMEEILPGITKRLQVMQTMKDLGNPSFTTSLVEKGGLGATLFTGNLQGAAAALGSIILNKPSIAVPLLRAVGATVPLVQSVMGNLAKYATISVTGNSATQAQQSNTPQQAQTDQIPDQAQTQQTTTDQGNQSSSPQSSSSYNLDELAQQKGFNLAKARAAGYSDSEIEQFLNQQK